MLYNTKRSRKTKKRGGTSNCTLNYLKILKTPEDMHKNYQTCCPKKFFGLRKNSSDYCKKLELNFHDALRAENYARGYSEDINEDELREIENSMNNNPYFIPPKKPWWKFWGKGRRTRRRRRR